MIASHIAETIMLNSKPINKIAIGGLTALLFAFTAMPSTATALPDDKLAALKCGENASESCCKNWVDAVVTAARADTDPGSMLSVLPRRVDRWVIIEHRSYCSIKKDIEVRTRQTQILAAK